MKKTLTALIVGLFVVGFSYPVFAQVLPDNWTGDTGIDTYQEATTVHGGTYSCRIDVNTGSQSSCDFSNDVTISVTAGNSYSVSFWYYTSAHVKIRLVLDWTGASSTYGSYSNAGSTSWEEFTSSGTVPTGATGVNIRLRCYDQSGFSAPETQYVDDVTFESPTGTPIVVTNGNFEDWPGIIISSISRQYKVPTAAQTCYVQCDITGGTAPYTANIKWDLNGVSQTDISMSGTGGDTYQGTISAQSDGARVEYYIDVTDAGKAHETSSTYGLFWGTSDISNSSGNIKAVDGDGVLYYDGYYARVTGVATVASGVFSSSNLDVYLQDDNGGINLYKGGASGTTITKGNSYTVFGVLDQYNGKAKIVPDDAGTDITDNGAGTLPSPAIVTMANLLADPEYYEGRLIGIQHSSKQSGTWPSSSSFVNLTMTDDGGTNTLTLRINNYTAPASEPTWPKDIAGIVSQYDYSSPYTSGYQWFSRSPDDYYSDGTLPVTLSTFTAQYLNSKPTLYWETQSETDNMGWFIYRNTIEDFTSSEEIAGMIPGHGTTTQPQSYIYEDASELQVEQTYYYWLESVDYGGTIHHYDKVVHVTILHPDDPGQHVTPVAYDISADPNPFSNTTEITLAINQISRVDVVIYNVKGQLVKSFDTAMTNADEEVSFQWNGKDNAGKSLSNGVYLYSVKINGKDYAFKQLILMK